MHELFTQELRVVNVGLQNSPTTWPRPAGRWSSSPGGRRPAATSTPGTTLARLVNDPTVEAANRVASGATSRRSRCSSTCCSRARRCRRSTGERRILHAGPPIAWSDMCGPGAIAGAIVYEGWAASPEEAMALAGWERSRWGRRTTTVPWGRWRHHQPVDAGVGRREPRCRQPGLPATQRGPGQGVALRRQRPGRHRTPAVDGQRPYAV